MDTTHTHNFVIIMMEDSYIAGCSQLIENDVDWEEGGEERSCSLPPNASDVVLSLGSKQFTPSTRGAKAEVLKRKRPKLPLQFTSTDFNIAASNHRDELDEALQALHRYSKRSCTSSGLHGTEV